MLGEVAFGVLGLLFLLTAIRTFASTFQQTFFGAPNANLAAMALAVFGTAFLALVLAWRLDVRRALLASTMVLGVATLGAAGARDNRLDLAFSVAAIAGGTWWLALLHSARPGDRPSPLPYALPLAIAGDVALRAEFRTVPIVDLPARLAVPIVAVADLLFLVVGIAVLASERRWTAPGGRGALGLLALPPLLLVGETGGTNGAQVAAAAGVDATLVGASFVATGVAAALLVLGRSGRRRVAAAALLALGAAALWAHQPTLSLIGGGALAAGVTIGSATLASGPLREVRSPAIAVLALGAGWLVFTVAAFGYYAFWAYLPAVWAATAVVALVLLVVPAPTSLRLREPLATFAAVIALLVPVVSAVSTPALPPPDEPRAVFRLMTYNIHQGFSAGQVPSLDALVQTISRESPDVLVLQEVVRGWMIDEQHDALGVLAERLGMRYVFGPNIGDLYGNAILSRYPITSVRRIHFAPGPSLKNQPRGAIVATIDDVVIVTTHLDELRDSSALRQDQVRAILSELDGAKVAVVAGDMNAEPSALEMSLFDAAGFGDLGAPAGPTTTGDDPPKRIDYVWGIGVSASQQHTVSALDSSDHRALVVNVTRPLR